MKITQDLIVFDLEATSSENENGHQENNNIIQIGAIYLKKTENKKYEITDRFNEIIKPKDEIISPFIEQLTGITNEVVKEKHHFDYAGTAFQEWAAKIALRIFEDLDNGVFIDNEKNGKANHFKLAKMS